MTTKCPYVFAAKSRAAMTAYILDRRGYSDNYRRYPFSWNVKVYRIDWAHPKGEYVLNPAFDAAWRAYVEEDDSVSANAFEDAQRVYSEKEWTSWPGDDQGDWEFSFCGRAGGHLCLESWKGETLAGIDGGDLSDWLTELPFPRLRRFYRALVCMDSDFTPEKASEEVEYHVNFQRGMWEETRQFKLDAELAKFVEQMESSRPDMYGEA